MEKLKRVKYCYIGLCIVIIVFEYSGDTRIQANFTFTTWYAWVNALMKLIVFFVKLCVHIELISMAIKMQKLLRKYGHVTGSRGEKVIIAAYLFFLGFFIYEFVLRPILVLLINTTEFTCST